MTDTAAPYEWKEANEHLRQIRQFEIEKVAHRVGNMKKNINDFTVGKEVVFDDKFFKNDDIFIYHEMAAKIPIYMFNRKYIIRKVNNNLFNIDIGLIQWFDYRVLKLV